MKIESNSRVSGTHVSFVRDATNRHACMSQESPATLLCLLILYFMVILIGIEMNQDISGEIVGKALEKGLLINAVRPNMIRFMPPLNVSIEEIDQAIEVISEILEDY